MGAFGVGVCCCRAERVRVCSRAKQKALRMPAALQVRRCGKLIQNPLIEE